MADDSRINHPVVQPEPAEAPVTQIDQFDEYRGMSYQQASREGLSLVQKASQSGAWIRIIGRLSALALIMELTKPTAHLCQPGCPACRAEAFRL